MSDEDIVELLLALGGEQFFVGLPNRLDTLIGRDGQNIPAGNRRVLALTRAAADRPRILVLHALEAMDLADIRQLSGARENVLARIAEATPGAGQVGMSGYSAP